MRVGCVISQILVLDEIGKHQGYRPRDSRHTMDKDLRNWHGYIRLLESLVDELDALLEVLGDIESLMVLSRDIFVERHLSSGMAKHGSAGSSQHRLDSVSFIGVNEYS